MENGWTQICGCDVYVEDGKILRALKNDGKESASVYRRMRDGSWNNACPLTVAAFKAGVKRGTMDVR